MYIQLKNITQQLKNNICSIKIEWEYGNQDPDLIEFYTNNAGNAISPGNLTQQLSVKKENKVTSTSFDVPCNSNISIIVCPRLVKDNTLLDKQPDDNEVEEFWEGFCIFKNIQTQGNGTGEIHKNLPVPSITNIVPIAASLNSKNRLRVSFIAGKNYDKYLVRWGSVFQPRNEDRQIEVEISGSSGTLEVDTLPKTNYRVYLKGGEDDFLGITTSYSDWSSDFNATSETKSTSLRFFLQNEDGSQGIKKIMRQMNSLRVFMGI
ncbi:MAG: hypothetical protein M3015_09215 [Bacteroidota bacterium]|nr:hypothetical protein [Bacteroidota bacterium]